jgi:hypothetical protein
MTIAWAPNLSNRNFPGNYSDWTIEDKIRLFEAQVFGWQLNIANEIINDPKNGHPHAGFAVLSILLNYFEMIGGYLEGVRGETTRKHFRVGITNVFSDLKTKQDIIKILYKEARCGMYHVGITGKSIILSRNYKGIITVIENSSERFIAIDPHRLTIHLLNHFKDYIESLNGNPSSVSATKFEQRFDFLRKRKVIL